MSQRLVATAYARSVRWRRSNHSRLGITHGVPMGRERLSYEESCRRLQPKYAEADTIPDMPIRMPRYDDAEPLGINFFRTFVGDGDDLGNLTLPRTFFGRSEITNASFQNTDLTESNLCWNDFTDVDFSEASLARADLRASNYTRVNFTGADLRDADLRRSSFDRCAFDRAEMAGAVLTRKQASTMALSAEQLAEIAWASDAGLEPDGG